MFSVTNRTVRRWLSVYRRDPDIEEFRRFVAGYLAMLPVRKDPSATDQRFIEYLLALTDGVTGRIIDLLRRAAMDALTHKSKSVGIDHLLVAGANLPAIINQRADFPIWDLITCHPH